jgi:hypothetical protein
MSGYFIVAVIAALAITLGVAKSVDGDQDSEHQNSKIEESKDDG